MNDQLFTVFGNLDYFEILWVGLRLCYNLLQFLWCDVDHKQFTEQFLYITINEVAW